MPTLIVIFSFNPVLLRVQVIVNLSKNIAPHRAALFLGSGPAQIVNQRHQFAVGLTRDLKEFLQQRLAAVHDLVAPFFRLLEVHLRSLRVLRECVQRGLNRFGFGMLHQLADKYGVSAERIRQLEKSAFNKIAEFITA